MRAITRALVTSWRIATPKFNVQDVEVTLRPVHRIGEKDHPVFQQAVLSVPLAVFQDARFDLLLHGRKIIKVTMEVEDAT